jgi:hypothetical protein
MKARHAAKLEFSSNDWSRKPEAGQEWHAASVSEIRAFMTPNDCWVPPIFRAAGSS